MPSLSCHVAITQGCFLFQFPSAVKNHPFSKLQVHNAAVQTRRVRVLTHKICVQTGTAWFLCSPCLQARSCCRDGNKAVPVNHRVAYMAREAMKAYDTPVVTHSKRTSTLVADKTKGLFFLEGTKIGECLLDSMTGVLSVKVIGGNALPSKVFTCPQRMLSWIELHLHEKGVYMVNHGAGGAQHRCRLGTLQVYF